MIEVVVFLGIVAIVLSVITLVYIFDVSSSKNVGSDPTSTPQDGTCQITDYHNEVVYFGCRESNYANALSDYIGKNNVTATSASVVVPFNAYFVSGYVVTFKKNEVCK